MRDTIDAGIRTANAKLARVEQIKKFTILPTAWEPGGEELTPAMKLKRKPIAAKYAAERTPSTPVGGDRPGDSGDTCGSVLPARPPGPQHAELTVLAISMSLLRVQRVTCEGTRRARSSMKLPTQPGSMMDVYGSEAMRAARVAANCIDSAALVLLTTGRR